jgi:branched-chain amino acid aminotransferase
LSLKAVGEHVRSWPGGTGGYKLALNYAPTFAPQQIAMKEGYDQILWLLNDKITEAGAMNFFAVFKRDDGGEFVDRGTIQPVILKFFIQTGTL